MTAEDAAAGTPRSGTGGDSGSPAAGGIVAAGGNAAARKNAAAGGNAVAGSGAPESGEPRRRSAHPFSRFLPPALILSGVVLAAWFSWERGGLHRPRGRDTQTFHTLAQAANLSAEHGFLGFFYRFVDGDGQVRYSPYNRFPPGGVFLIRAAIAPFTGDLSAQIRAARLLMFAFFAGLAVVAYLALFRLTGRRWLAFAAILLASSSFYWDSIDLVETEIAPDLFFFLLTFHGMVIFEQEGRFRQLLVKTGAALLVGWHVYALLAPFLVFGAARVWARAGRRLRAGRRENEREGNDRFPVRRFARETLRRAGAVLRSRYPLLGAAAFFFGLGILGWNFRAEYAAFGGETAFRDLPSVQSLIYRTGQSETFNELYAEAVDWRPYLGGQLLRLGWMAAPFALPGNLRPFHDPEGQPLHDRATAFAALVLGVGLLGLPSLRNRGLFSVLALSGFCWSLPMRNNTAFHDFETIWYLGLTLVFWTVVLTALSRWFGRGFLPGAAVFAALVFGYSWRALAAEGYDPERAAYWRRVEADFDEIRTLTEGGTVFWPEWRHRDPPFRGTNLFPFYLSGRVLVIRDDVRRAGDFALRERRRPSPALLTPDNREMFLYFRDALDGDLFREIEADAVPGIRARFAVYLRNGWVLYVREGCSAEDLEEPFFLRFVPEEGAGERAGEAGRSGAERGRDPEGPDPVVADFGNGYFESRYFESRGFERTDSGDLVFDFDSQAFTTRERCAAGVRLPESGVARLETGQFARTGDGGRRILWEGAIPVAGAGSGR